MEPLRTSAGWRVLDGFGGSVRAVSRSVCPASVDELAQVFAAARGERLTLSRERDPELFRAVVAGLGLLGAVTRVKLQLKHVESGELRVRPFVARTLEQMFDTFVERMPDSDYLVGWVDCFAAGAAL